MAKRIKSRSDTKLDSEARRDRAYDDRFVASGCDMDIKTGLDQALKDPMLAKQDTRVHAIEPDNALRLSGNLMTNSQSPCS